MTVLIIFKILLFIIIPVFWRLGGMNKLAWIRDLWIPILMGIYVGLVIIWWIGLLTIVGFQIIKLGYGIPDDTDTGSMLSRFVYNVLGIKKSWLVRGMAGLLYGLVGGACVFIYTKSYCYWGIYCFINFFLNMVGEKMKWKDYIVEPLAGIGVVSLIFFI